MGSDAPGQGVAVSRGINGSDTGEEAWDRPRVPGTAASMDRVNEVLDRVPALASLPRRVVGHLSHSANRVCRVSLGGDDFVVRFPGRRRFIEVSSEFENQRSAAEAGLAPHPMALDRDTGAIVSRWIEGSTPPPSSAADLLESLAVCLARLHHGTRDFIDRFEPGQALSWNLDASSSPDARILRLAGRARSRLAEVAPALPVNCHGDPTAGNIVGHAGRLCFIDWEYSHRNRADWDLAIVCNGQDMGPTRTGRFLGRYNDAAAAYEAEPVSPGGLAVLRGVTALASAAWCAHNDRTRTEFDRDLSMAEAFL